MTNSLPLKVLFAGTPEFAAEHLRALISSRHEVIGVYTQPDRPAGRGKKLTASAVKMTALEHGLRVYQPPSFKANEAVETLASLKPDVLIVVAYGLILPQAVLDVPNYGCLNVHASILPRWRGAAPIQRAIEAGDDQTGITIMQMDAGLDTGNMLHKVFCHISPNETATTLHDKLADMGPSALLATLEDLSCGQLNPTTQDDTQATYASKLQKAEASIDWSLPASAIDRRIRAFNPFPLCVSSLITKEGEPAIEKIKIHRAKIVENTQNTSLQAGHIAHLDKRSLVVACGQNYLSLEMLQLPGKKPVDITSFINGLRALTATSYFI